MSKAVIVGGYGRVGREAALALAPALPGRVVVAGRDRGRAQAAAARVGHGAEGRRVDASDPSRALDDAALVLMCTEPPGTELARRCLTSRVHYVDVTADSDRLSALEGLDPVARAAGVTGALSIGLAPGVTNLLAAHVVRGQRSPTERLDTLVVVGVGDAHGPAAIEWTLDALADADAFALRTRFRLPGRARPVRAFSFGFPEARTLPVTLGVSRVTSWLALDPPAATLGAALAARSGAARALRRGPLRRAALHALGAAAPGPDRYVAAARFSGRQSVLTGRREASLTGLVAAEAARRLLERGATPGVFHIEQLFDPVDVLDRLASEDPSVRLTLQSG
jgi:saccharopine dehydrogenase (NAD+, L-lysine forming)